MKTRTINLLGFDIDIYQFGSAFYMYPQFNGNAEYKVNKEGYKALTHWLRIINSLKHIREFWEI